MKKRMGAVLAVIYAALLCCAGMAWGQEAAAQPEAAEQYTLHFSGDGFLQGTVTAQRDRAGKVTIVSNLSGDGYYYLKPALCPLIPEWAGQVEVHKDSGEIVIEGNTLTVTDADGRWSETVAEGSATTTTNSSGGWTKRVVEGSVTTTTDSNGDWIKRVVEGSTTTTTHSNGDWYKTVVDGNITTGTNSYGISWKEVVDGNATTYTDSDGWWEKTVVDDNITTYTNSDGHKEVVDKQGRSISIRLELVEE